MRHQLSGIYAAAVTPLKPDYSPDLDAVPEHLSFLARRGCHGVLLLGTTGEGPSFSTRERSEIFRAGARLREQHPECRLLAGTGTPSLTETIQITRQAFDLGMDAVVVLPPYYYRKAGDEGLFAWFSQLIQQALPADGSLLGYHFPGMAGIGFSLPLLQRLKDAFPRQFAGIKDSSHDSEFAHLLGETFGGELLVLTGTDSYLQWSLENCGAGCITAPANLISPDLRATWDAIEQKRDSTALQAEVTRLREILEKYPPFPPLLKALLVRKHAFPGALVRPPLEQASEAVVEAALGELGE